MQESIAFGVIEGVEHLLAGIDAIERRHGDIDVSVRDKRPEMP